MRSDLACKSCIEKWRERIQVHLRRIVHCGQPVWHKGGPKFNDLLPLPRTASIAALETPSHLCLAQPLAGSGLGGRAAQSRTRGRAAFQRALSAGLESRPRRGRGLARGRPRSSAHGALSGCGHASLIHQAFIGSATPDTSWMDSLTVSRLSLCVHRVKALTVCGNRSGASPDLSSVGHASEE